MASHSVNPSLLRRINERAVFEHLLRHGPSSRMQLTQLMRVSVPTVSKAIARLHEAGLLEELGAEPATQVGRPGLVYRLARETAQVIGIAVSAHDCAILATGLDGNAHPDRTRRFAIPNSYPKLVDRIAKAARDLMPDDVATIGIGISVPGEVDLRTQRILLSPNLHITDGRSLSLDIQKRLGCDRVVMFQDTTSGCMAARLWGPARGLRDFVLVGVHEGFGASIVSGGRMIVGQARMASQLGHITVDRDGRLCGCGNRGCLETVATDASLLRRVSERLGQELEFDDLAERVASDVLDVTAELDETLEYLSIGLAAAINIFNPKAVFIDARMLDLADDAFDRLTEMTEQHAFAPRFERCRIERFTIDNTRGAIACILDQIMKSLGPDLQ